MNEKKIEVSQEDLSALTKLLKVLVEVGEAEEPTSLLVTTSGASHTVNVNMDEAESKESVFSTREQLIDFIQRRLICTEESVINLINLQECNDNTSRERGMSYVILGEVCRLRANVISNF